MDSNNPVFTADWFTTRAKEWAVLLKDFNITKEVKYLELGTYEGRSLLWMLDNVLEHEKSTADVIDGWFDKEIERRFLSNIITSAYQKVFIHKGLVQDKLGILYALRKKYYDIIYIDADHASNSVIRDACMCFEMLKINGLIIFDDYLWKNTNNSPQTMKEAIDSWLAAYNGFYETVFNGYQVVIKKIK